MTRCNGNSKSKLIPQKWIVLHMEATHNCSPLILPDWFYSCSASVHRTISCINLQPNQVAQVVQLLYDCTSISAVARRFAVSLSTVSSVWRRYQESTSYTRRAGQGHTGVHVSDRTGLCVRTPELAGPPLAPHSLHRWEQVHTEYMWQAWKSLQKLW